MEQTMLPRKATLVATLAALILFTGCATQPKDESGKANLKDEATATLNKFKRQDTSLDAFMSKGDGYAIFPGIGKGGLGVGGAFGRGCVYEKGQFIGYTKMEQATVGFQAGGQEYAELIVFETPEAINKFKAGNFAFSAEASAVALKAGAAAAASFKNGVAVFTMTNAGLMYEASIGGQRFTYEAAEDTSVKR
jgi:lipid-binding SYLF domain-containing protein